MYLRHKEYSGRTVAHVLAHQIQPELAETIYEAAPFLWKELANTQTILSRTLGGWTPLHCIADQDHRKVPDWRIKNMLSLLIHTVSYETATLQNNKGQTFMHLACYRGNYVFVKHALDTMFDLFTEEQIASLLNTPNNDNKFVADTAIYNSRIKALIISKNGIHNTDPPADWQDRPRLPEDHPWHRRYQVSEQSRVVMADK